MIARILEEKTTLRHDCSCPSFLTFLAELIMHCVLQEVMGNDNAAGYANVKNSWIDCFYSPTTSKVKYDFLHLLQKK